MDKQKAGALTPAFLITCHLSLVTAFHIFVPHSGQNFGVPSG